MIKEQMHIYIKHPELIDNDIFNELEDIIKQYPYFHLARILYLKGLYAKNKDKFILELKKATVYIPDKKQLFKFLNEDVNLSSYKQKFNTLNEATEERSNTTSSNSEEDLLEFEVTSIDSVPMYNLESDTNVLKEDNKVEQKDNQQLIDNFIKNTPHISKAINKDIESRNYADKSEIDGECMTETLAKIYVKQKLYRKAIAVYEKLSLKNPQKNAFFVNRVIELKKILNDKL